jgi:hypothetical protein
VHEAVRGSVFGCEFGGAEGVGEVEGLNWDDEIRGRGVCLEGLYDTKRTEGFVDMLKEEEL